MNPHIHVQEYRAGSLYGSLGRTCIVHPLRTCCLLPLKTADRHHSLLTQRHICQSYVVLWPSLAHAALQPSHCEVFEPQKLNTNKYLQPHKFQNTRVFWHCFLNGDINRDKEFLRVHLPLLSNIPSTGQWSRALAQQSVCVLLTLQGLVFTIAHYLWI